MALAGFAALDDQALARPWSWRDRPMDIRYALYRTLEEAQEAHARVSAAPHPEARRILSLAQRAFGDLRGLLVGLADGLVDEVPRPGEWSLRETLRHMLYVERRYALQTRHAAERADDEPIRLPDDRMPTLAQIDASGELGMVLARLGEARAETNRTLGGVPAAAMGRPTIWVQYDIDVRFRLHRFASHLVEHTIQCEKVLDGLGWRPTEGRRIARRLSALLGELDGLGAADEVSALEERLAERFASAGSPGGVVRERGAQVRGGA
jgi:hypothetical protein